MRDITLALRAYLREPSFLRWEVLSREWGTVEPIHPPSEAAALAEHQAYWSQQQLFLSLLLAHYGWQRYCEALLHGRRLASGQREASFGSSFFVLDWLVEERELLTSPDALWMVVAQSRLNAVGKTLLCSQSIQLAPLSDQLLQTALMALRSQPLFHSQQSLGEWLAEEGKAVSEHHGTLKVASQAANRRVAKRITGLAAAILLVGGLAFFGAVTQLWLLGVVLVVGGGVAMFYPQFEEYTSLMLHRATVDPSNDASREPSPAPHSPVLRFSQAAATEVDMPYAALVRYARYLSWQRQPGYLWGERALSRGALDTYASELAQQLLAHPQLTTLDFRGCELAGAHWATFFQALDSNVFIQQVHFDDESDEGYRSVALCSRNQAYWAALRIVQGWDGAVPMNEAKAQVLHRTLSEFSSRVDQAISCLSKAKKKTLDSVKDEITVALSQLRPDEVGVLVMHDAAPLDSSLRLDWREIESRVGSAGPDSEVGALLEEAQRILELWEQRRYRALLDIPLDTHDQAVFKKAAIRLLRKWHGDKLDPLLVYFPSEKQEQLRRMASGIQRFLNDLKDNSIYPRQAEPLEPVVFNAAEEESIFSLDRKLAVFQEREEAAERGAALAETRIAAARKETAELEREAAELKRETAELKEESHQLKEELAEVKTLLYQLLAGRQGAAVPEEEELGNGPRFLGP